jgi:hypothetical protein
MYAIIAYDGAPSSIKKDFELDDKPSYASSIPVVNMPLARVLSERKDIFDSGHFVARKVAI